MVAFYGTELENRLMLGTSQYPSPAILERAFKTSKASVATVSLRREGRDGARGHARALLPRRRRGLRGRLHRRLLRRVRPGPLDRRRHHPRQAHRARALPRVGRDARAHHLHRRRRHGGRGAPRDRRALHARRAADVGPRRRVHRRADGRLCGDRHR